MEICYHNCSPNVLSRRVFATGVVSAGLGLPTLAQASKRGPAIGHIEKTIGEVFVRDRQNVVRSTQSQEALYPFDRLSTGARTSQGLAFSLLPQTEVFMGSGTTAQISFFDQIATTHEELTRWPQLLFTPGRYEVRMRRSTTQVSDLLNRLRVITPSASLILYTARAAIDVDYDQTRVAMLSDAGEDAPLKVPGSNSTDVASKGDESILGYQPLISASTKMGDAWLSIPGHIISLTAQRPPSAPQFLSAENYAAIDARFADLA